jgi:translation initiation factor 2B subunit (eIF-2B alpha/beta/delta family)
MASDRALVDDDGAGGSHQSPFLTEGMQTAHSPLKLLHLLYDLTPAHYISMVISEVGQLPPTSVPVVIREYRVDL